jgi:hypothetical protein
MQSNIVGTTTAAAIAKKTSWWVERAIHKGCAEYVFGGSHNLLISDRACIRKEKDSKMKMPNILLFAAKRNRPEFISGMST